MSTPATPANLNTDHDAAVARDHTSQDSTSTQGQGVSHGASPLLPEYAAFEPPLPAGALPTWSIVVEFCDRCRWLHRATWTQTELFLTFGPKYTPAAAAATTSSTVGASPPPPSVQSITLLPGTTDETAGRFRVWVYGGGGGSSGAQRQPRCIYDRKVRGGFPEMKELKQLVRDVISPGQSLGHSDKGAHDKRTPAPAAIDHANGGGQRIGEDSQPPLVDGPGTGAGVGSRTNGSGDTATSATITGSQSASSGKPEGEPKDVSGGKPTFGTGHEPNTGTASVAGAGTR